VPTGFSVQERFSVLVQLKLGDDYVGGFNANGDGLSIRLVTLHSFDLDFPLLSVHSGHLALTVVVSSSHDDDLIITADWERAYVVLFSQLLG